MCAFLLQNLVVSILQLFPTFTMLFDVVPFVGLLVAHEALAIPSPLAARVTHGREGHQSQLYSGFNGNVNGVTNTSRNWAGAIWTENDVFYAC